MDKIDKIIQLYNSRYESDISELSILIEYSDILFTKKETEKLIKFYDIEFEKKF